MNTDIKTKITALIDSLELAIGSKCDKNFSSDFNYTKNRLFEIIDEIEKKIEDNQIEQDIINDVLKGY